MIRFQSFLIYWDLLCVLTCNLFCRICHARLKGMCILLFGDRMFWIFLLGLSVQCVIQNYFFLVDFLSGWSIHWYKWDVKVLYWLCFCQFLPTYLQIVALCIQVLPCSVHIYNCYILLLYCSLYHYIVYFCVSCYSLCVKVYFVQCKYCYPSFLFTVICMVKVFLSLHFQSVFVFRSEVSLL